MTTTTTGAEILARVKPTRAEATAIICLRPDLLNKWAALEDDLTDLRAKNGERASTLSTAKRATKAERELAEQVLAVEAEIDAAQVKFLLRAMPKDAYQALLDEHPPRKDNRFDVMAGHNRAAVEDAGVRACMVEPVFEDCAIKGCEHDECGSWQQFLTVCNPSEWAELRRAFNEANGAVSSTPKSRLASQVLRNGDSD